MARVLVELEINERGAEKIGQTSGSLKDLGQQSKKTNDALSSMFQGIGQAVGQRAFAAIEALPGALVGASAAAARALYEISAALVETGGRLADLSAKTSLSTDFLQKMGYAGDLVGVTLEDISAAALTMQKEIVAGDDVFARLGLSISKLRAMKPEDAFAAVAEQVAKIKDPMLQNAAATEAFGKGAAQIMPLIRSDIAGAAEEAKRLGLVLGGETIAAADALGDEATKLAKAWEGVQNQFAAVIVESPQLLEAFRSMVSLLGETARWAHDNRGALAELLSIAMGFGVSAVTAFRSAASGAEQLGSSLRLIQDAVPGMRQALEVAEDLAFLLGRANRRSNLSASSRAMTELAGGGINFRVGLDKLTEAQKAAAKAAEEHSRKIGELVFDFMGGNATSKLHDYSTALAEMGGVASMNTVMFERWHAAIRSLMADGGRLPESLRNAGFGIDPRLQSLSVSEDAFGPGWREQTRGQADPGVKWYVEWYGKIERAVNRIQQAWQLAAQAVAIYQNGVQGASRWGGLVSGAMAGAQTAGLPGLIIGGALGYFGGKEGEQRNLNALHAELVALQAQAKAAGIALMETFDPDSAQGMLRAIDEINRALGLQVEANQALDDAMQRWGITIDQLGPRFREQRLHEQAVELLQDFRILEAAGVDVTVIIASMGGALAEFFQAAIRTGTAIPEHMRPLLQLLIDNKLLLDENGRAFETVEETGIGFSRDLTGAIQGLIDKITELVNALRGIPNIIPIEIQYRTTGSPPPGPTGGDPEHPGWFGPGYNYDNTTDQDNNPSTGAGYADGGYIPATPGGRLIRVAEGGEGEYVIPESKARRGGSEEHSAAPLWTAPQETITVNLNVAGDQLDQILIRRIRAGHYALAGISGRYSPP